MNAIRPIALVSVVAFCLPGCMLELVGSTAIQSGLAAESASTGQKAMQKAQGFNDEKELNSAIQAHFAEYGAFPATLDALVPQFMVKIPPAPTGSVWQYDAASGTVYAGAPARERQVAVIPPPTDADYKSLETLHSAIMAYGQNTGYYPSTLNDLAPGYVSSVPKTASGKNFQYDPATGSVYHPYDLQQARQAERAAQQQAQPQQRRGMPAGAGGPLGETLTTINMQQQMNAQSNAGVTGAGSAGRENVRNAGDAQNQRHQKAMKDLGL